MKFVKLTIILMVMFAETKSLWEGLMQSAASQHNKNFCTRQIKAMHKSKEMIVENQLILGITQRAKDHCCKEFRVAQSTDKALVILQNQVSKTQLKDIIDQLPGVKKKEHDMVAFNRLQQAELRLISKHASAVQSIYETLNLITPGIAAAVNGVAGAVPITNSILSGRPAQTNINPAKFAPYWHIICEFSDDDRVLQRICQLNGSHEWQNAWNDWHAAWLIAQNAIALLDEQSIIVGRLDDAIYDLQIISHRLRENKAEQDKKYPQEEVNKKPVLEAILSSGITMEMFIELELNKQGLSSDKRIRCACGTNGTIQYEGRTLTTDNDGIPSISQLVIPAIDEDEISQCSEYLKGYGKDL